MNDTPEHIQQLQLKLWLAKTPAERFLQFLTDNDIMFQGILAAKQARQKKFEKKNSGEEKKNQKNEMPK